MARKKVAQPTLTEVRLKTAPCAPAIREKVLAWVLGGYKGDHRDEPRAATALVQTRRAPHRWAKTEYHLAQREAVETAVYLFEVAKVRRATALIEKFSAQSDL